MKNLTTEQRDSVIGIDPEIKTLVRRFIPSDAIEIVEARVNRLVKRADAKGFPRPALLIGPTEVRKITTDQPNGLGGYVQEDIEYTEIAIVAKGTLAISGWHLLAVIAPVIEADGTTIGMPTTVPG